jgi:hypothetical protein
MRRVDPMRALLCALVLTVAPLPADAQQTPPAAQQPPAARDSTTPATVVNAADAKLMFEREVYNYPGRGRRDPFAPLTGSDAGPLFADLKLTAILYVADAPAESIVTIADATKKVHRVRRGDTVGNATIVDIGPNRVVFSINDFGVRRQAVLDLKPQPQGREP